VTDTFISGIGLKRKNRSIMVKKILSILVLFLVVLNNSTYAQHVAYIQVNDGLASRSHLTSITVAFDVPVTASSGAFSITNIGLTTVQNTPLDQSQITVSTTDNIIYVISFLSGPGVVTRGPVGNNSLVDGNYVLSIDQTKVVDGNGNQLLDVINFGEHASHNLFRLYGDYNGTGAVDGSDIVGYRKAQVTYDTNFDYNGDGVVNATDSPFFAANYGKRRRTNF
jgi:hypothetical protein